MEVCTCQKKKKKPLPKNWQTQCTGKITNLRIQKIKAQFLSKEQPHLAIAEIILVSMYSLWRKKIWVHQAEMLPTSSIFKNLDLLELLSSPSAKSLSLFSYKIKTWVSAGVNNISILPIIASSFILAWLRVIIILWKVHSLFCLKLLLELMHFHFSTFHSINLKSNMHFFWLRQLLSFIPYTKVISLNA